MNYYLLQAEGLENLLSKSDATIIGVLLVVCSLLIYWIIRQDNKIESRDSYIKEQDKETLKILLELTNTLKTKQESDKDVKTEVGNINTTVTDTNSTLKSLTNVIQNKLLNMN